MELILNYVMLDRVISLPEIKFSSDNARIWLYSMVDANPDVIFFYTTPTTDIFE